MPNAIGKTSRMGIGKESLDNPGVSVVPKYWLPLTEKNPGISAEYIPDESDYGRIEKTSASEVVFSMGSPSMSGYLHNRTSGIMFLAALGQVVTTDFDGDSGDLPVYKHIFTILNNNRHPSFTLAVKDANQNFVYPYSKLQNLSLTMEKKQNAMFEASFMSRKKKTTSNEPFDIADEKFNSRHASAKIAATIADLGSAAILDVEMLKVNITKELLMQDSLGHTEPVNIYNGTMSVEVEFEVLADSTTLQDFYEQGTKRAIEINLVNTQEIIGAETNPSVKITLASVVLEKMDYSYSMGELNRYKFVAMAHYVQGTTETISIELINDVDTY